MKKRTENEFDFQISTEEEGERVPKRTEKVKIDRRTAHRYEMLRAFHNKKAKDAVRPPEPKGRAKEKEEMSSASSSPTSIGTTARKKGKKTWRMKTATFRSCVMFLGFVCATFYFHMFLQQEYFRRCKSNVIRVVLFKQSHMCTHMLNVLNVIENTYFYGMKRIIDTVLIPLYDAGFAFN